MREYLHMLTETTRLVTEAAKAGKTADEITADSVLIDFKKWVGGYLTGTFAFWTRTIVREVVPGTGWGPSICEPLTAILVDGTVSDAVAEYRRLKKTQPDAFDFREAHLNMLGYQLMMRDRADDAMEIFKLNMEMFPESFNVYDSYGEILLAKGDTAQSIVNYEKSVELNPDNANAVTILEKLRK
jgi:tetratricopeptide (TPR) repeat protein